MENELTHWGVKGQKWGVRRYQNKDGSLTAAGKKRQKDWSDDAKEASNLKKKKLSQMSNSEIRKLNERLQLETNYKNLTKSKSFVKDIGKNSAKEVAKGIASKAITAAVSAAVVAGVTHYAKGGMNAKEAKVADFLIDVFKKK